MKLKIIKKEDRGFALLFSVLVSSLLLTIGLSIFSIALKELAISTATRQSVHAFYAADSGREYVKYRDTKIGDLFTFDAGISSGIATSTEVSSFVSDEDGSNFTVTISKLKELGATANILTEITSRGYDTKSGDRVERAIFQSY